MRKKNEREYVTADWLAQTIPEIAESFREGDAAVVENETYRIIRLTRHGALAVSEYFVGRIMCECFKGYLPQEVAKQVLDDGSVEYSVDLYSKRPAR